QHGCRAGAAGAQVVHVHGGADAEVRAPAGLHVLGMPEPAPVIGTASWQLLARVLSRRSDGSPSVISLYQAFARVPADLRGDGAGRATRGAAQIWMIGNAHGKHKGSV